MRPTALFSASFICAWNASSIAFFSTARRSSPPPPLPPAPRTQIMKHLPRNPQQLERLEIENAELRGALAGGSGGGELRRAAEKKAMEDAFHAQMNDAENKAVGRIAEVGAKCHAQVSEMQAVVGSLEARLVDREAQLQHSDKELKRAQQAIAEITLIYQAREKDFVSELHRAQLGHASLRHSPSMDMQQQQQ
eukprot:gene9391-14563_t